jgi:ActR/RegA family two-component response regulator
MLDDVTILIVEDGEEYLENLSRFVAGPRYVQAHSGAEAIAILHREPVDLIYLDMRFDRTARDLLLGDHEEATRECNGDARRGWRYLQNNQGLYILAALRAEELGGIPVILAYDFSGEPRRAATLQKVHPSMTWVPDTVTPEEIRRAIAARLGRDGGG